MIAAGGLLIGSAAAAFLLLQGRILGVSGLFSSLIRRQGEWQQAGALIAGLILGGIFLKLSGLVGFTMGVPRGFPLVLLAGILVGGGTYIGGGCTSGHGICGVARASPRSLTATAVFMLTGVITVYTTRRLGWFAP